MVAAHASQPQYCRVSWKVCAYLSWQQHIQQVPGGREAAAQGVPRLAAAHVHLVGLLLHLVSAQVDQPQHNDAAFGATQAHVAPVRGVYLDAGQGMLCTKILAPQHRPSCRQLARFAAVCRSQACESFSMLPVQVEARAHALCMGLAMVLASTKS